MIQLTAVVLLFSVLVSQSPQGQAPAPLEMKTYQMVFLRKGAKTDNPTDAAKMQQEHLANLIALNQRRVNLLFGPFLDNGDLRGIAIVDAPDGVAAVKLFADDPYVKAGYIAVDVRPWMGPQGWFNPPLEPPTPEPLILGFLVRGTQASQIAADAQDIQEGHLAYMDALTKQGKLVAAGPFLDDSPIRGLVIYRVATVEEAKALAAGDPAVKAGRLVLDARPWMTFKGILK